MQDVPAPEPDVSPDPLEVPYAEISPDALRGVIESFVLREGTEYGEHDFTLTQKVAQVLAQLQRREARVMFDPETESVTIVLRNAAQPRSSGR